VSDLLADLTAQLRELERQGLRRRLRSAGGIDFSSNDYLGLSRHPELTARMQSRLSGPPGAPASRLLRGNTPAHVQLEARLANWKGTEAALLFPSGYQANIAVLSTLVSPRDHVITDTLNHASIIDGLRLARCEKTIVPHLDAGAIERALQRPLRRGRRFLVTESLFSMDGDIAPLDRYAELAERHGASLIVDDAHGTGLYGSRGSGLAEHFDTARRALAIVSTFGKAIGLHGAFVAGPDAVIDYLVNRARAFIFSTAPAPLLIAAIEAALDLAESAPERRNRTRQLADRLRARLRAAGLDCLSSEGPIVPVMLGSNERALEVAGRVQDAGFDVRAIRPPTVAPGSARLRISVHADHAEAEIDRLADAVITAASSSLVSRLPSPVSS
jgi:8-amino-7-oxononanoate synthase